MRILVRSPAHHFIHFMTDFFAV